LVPMDNPLDNPEVRQALEPYLPEYRIELVWPSGKPHADSVMGALHARDFRIVSWLLSRAFPGFDPFTDCFKDPARFSTSKIIDRIADMAAWHGRYDVCEWIVGEGHALTMFAKSVVDFRNNTDIMSLVRWEEWQNLEDAAFSGHINCIRYAISEGRSALDERLCSAAARGGRLQTLEFLKKNGCPWNHDLFVSCTDYIDYLINERDGDDGAHDECRDVLRCVEYARANGCPEAPRGGGTGSPDAS
jgi:hypothetical protein